jgi:hypothetical protein
VLDITEELDSIRNVLSERGIEFGLCGGMAMAIYGFVRATVDLDLLVKREDVEAINAAAASLGYIVDTKRASKIDTASGDSLALDLIVVTDETRQLWNERKVILWREKPLTVVSRSGLITLKRLRGTLQDFADIDRLPEETDSSIELRMKRLGQIRNLCLSLGKAGAEARRKGLPGMFTPSTSKASADR